MEFTVRQKIMAVTAVVIAVGIFTTSVLAHDHRHVGDYNFVVGFITEPAYEGLANGLEVRVTKTGHEEDGHTRQSFLGKTEGATEPLGVAVNTEGHGMLFVSPGLNHEDTFSFEPGHGLAGLTIPYHNQLDPAMSGKISVSHDSQGSDRVDVDIQESMFMPTDVAVGPGTKIVWTNRTSSPQAVTSSAIPMGDRADAETIQVPVEGLEETLRVEITYVPTGESRLLELRAVAEHSGRYIADLIPTAQGVYELRVFGSIEGNSVDETFVSYGGGGGFSDVLPASDLQFPVQLPEVREIEGAVRGALDTAQQAQNAALAAQSASATNGSSSGNTLGIIGIVLGGLGVLAGAAGLVVAIMSRESSASVARQ